MAKQSQITNFLKKVKEVEFPEIQITESVEIHKQFYEDCMKDCQNETCIAAKKKRKFVEEFKILKRPYASVNWLCPKKMTK